MNSLMVVLGGALGAWARYSLFVLLEKKSEHFPWHTLTVNLAGCFLIGLIVEFFALKSHLPLAVKLFLVTGFLGAFTTFSTFALDIGLLLEKHAYLKSCVYVAASVAFGIGGYFIAIWIVRLLLGRG